MTVVRTVMGHTLEIQRARTLRGHWQVRADGRLLGMVVFDVAGWHTVPTPSGDGPLPVLHSPTLALALRSLVSETIERSIHDPQDGEGAVA